MKVKINNISIRAISACVPKNRLDMLSLGGDFGDSEVRRIISTTGINSIRQVDNNTTASDLCFIAAKDILKKLNLGPDEIDGLIFVSQTRDYILPQTSHILQSRLGFKEDTICFDLPVGCNGYIYGLFQAALLIQSSACDKVLVLSGDTTTKIINDNDRSVKMVFGDGGSATLIESGTKEMSFIIYSDGEKYEDLIIRSGGSRIPHSERSDVLVTDNDGNSRKSSDLFMDGMSIFNFAIKRVPTVIQEILTYTGWRKEDVDLFALHQANKFMVDYLRKKINLPLDKIPIVVDGFGNTGPATIPIVLTETLCNRDNDYYKKVILCGFGVGLSWGALSCNLSETKIFKTIEY